MEQIGGADREPNATSAQKGAEIWAGQETRVMNWGHEITGRLPLIERGAEEPLLPIIASAPKWSILEES